MRKDMIALALAVTITMFGLVAEIPACEWAEGFFYEVQGLRGRVVGTDVTLFRHIRWLRQSFSRSNGTLTLYVYARRKSWNDMVLVKRVVADGTGGFDFGNVPAGHYTLSVSDKDLNIADRFDVEIRVPYQAKQSVTIDISPNFPDCSGGHEITVESSGGISRNIN